MNIQLNRPLAFLDLETTGVNLASDRIVEFAIVKVMPDGSDIRKRRLINPQIPIPAEVSAIHGITDEMVKDAPTFRDIANDIRQFLDNCDLAGYNSAPDLNSTLQTAVCSMYRRSSMYWSPEHSPPRCASTAMRI